MDSQHRWLDIEDELYPEVVMVKQIIFQNCTNGDLTQFCTQITYNSFKRQIDLAPVIYKYFIENSPKFQSESIKNYSYQISILDRAQQKFYYIGSFPNDDSFTLGEQFLSEQILHLIVKIQEKMFHHVAQFAEQLQKMYPVDQMEELAINEEKPQLTEPQYISKQQEGIEQNLKGKPNKRKTIEEVLKIVAQWRKLILIKKLSSAEAADKVGLSKRSLQDYFTTIKLAQKYGFEFQTKMKNWFAQLRNFVKQNHQTKVAPKVQILQKFKNIKK